MLPDRVSVFAVFVDHLFTSRLEFPETVGRDSLIPQVTVWIVGFRELTVQWPVYNSNLRFAGHSDITPAGEKVTIA
jgi:hypothetical protein